MQTNNTTIISRGQHLSLKERIEIQCMLSKDYSHRQIALELDRSHATINNEIKRGTIEQKKKVNGVTFYFEVYKADSAQKNYENKRKKSRKPFKLMSVFLFLEYAIKKIQEDNWSPDAIVGSAKITGLFEPESMVSTKTLYKYIDLGLLKITNLDLLLKVRRNTRKATSRANRRILGTSIEKRPEHINDRSEFGHWEIDTVIGTNSKDEPVLLTLTERKTRFEIIIKISGKTEKAVNEAIQDLMDNEYSEKLFKSITSDNGTEFSSLSEAVSAVAGVYFTHSYSSYERGDK